MARHGRWVLALVSAAVVLAIALASQRPPRVARSVPPPTVRDGAVVGAVSDELHTIIAGALVEVVVITDESVPRVVGSTTSKTDGTFDLPLPAAARGEPRGVVLVRASKDGYATAGRRLDPSTPGLRHDFVLEKESSTVTVTVKSARGGTVAGAEVVLSIEPMISEPNVLVVLHDQSDAEGTVAFRGVSPAVSTLHWSAVARGHGAAYGEVAKPRGAAPIVIDAVLDGGLSVAVDVVDARGKPIAGVAVHGFEPEGPWLDDETSGTDGVARFSAAPRRDVFFEPRGGWTAVGSSDRARLVVTPGTREARVRLVLEPAGSIAGRVVTTRGEPVVGAAVAAIPSAATRARPHTTTTDADGRFTIDGLPSEVRFDVDSQHADFAPAFARDVAAPRNDLRLVLAAGGSIAGRVVDEVGRGAEGAEVYAQRIEEAKEGTTALPGAGRRQSDASGSYRIDHLLPGTYRVEVRSDARMVGGSPAIEVRTAQVEEGVVVRLGDVAIARPGEIRGSVRVAGGDPPSRVTALLTSAGSRSTPQRFDVTVGRDGAFVLAAVAKGTYSLALHTPEHGFAVAPDIRVAADAATDVRVTLDGQHELAGTVVDAEGNAVPSARVDVFAADDDAQRQWELVGRAPTNFTGNTATTDATGRFVARGIHAGTHRIRVTKDGMPAIAIDTLVPASPVVLTLPRPARLEIAVGGARRTPSGVVVLLDSTTRAGFSGSMVTDARGRARFDGLAPGLYRARAIVPGMREVSITLREGETKSAALD